MKLDIEYLITPLLAKIDIKNHLRSGDEVYSFLLETGYQLLPFPIRMVVSESVYKQFCIDRKDEILGFVWVRCSNCNAEKMRLSKCGFCGGKT